MFKKISIVSLAIAFVMVALPSSVFAHVTVKPAEVGVAARQVFTVSVPNESDTAQVVGLRLVVPEGLTSVTPNAKPGWTINVTKTGEGESALVSEITWTGGQIPVGQRDEFLFQTKTPAGATELNWKAYETSSTGEITSWDQQPQEGKDVEHPYSVTKVTNDLASKDAAAHSDSSHETHEDKANYALMLSGVALVVALLALLRTRTTTPPSSKK